MTKILKTLLIDDEVLALDLLEHLLKDNTHVDVVGRAQSADEARHLLQKIEVDLLILDIEMPGQNGVEFLASLSPQVLPMVIFVTAFDSYAVQAFDHHAVDYLLKPTDKNRINTAIERALERGQLKTQENVTNAIDSLLPEVSSNHDESLQKLTIKDNGEVQFINYDDIYWIDAAGDYMCVHTPERTHIMRSTMKNLENQLPDNSFVRVHRSAIVNVSHIESAQILQKGESLLKLTGGGEVKVSRNFRQNIARFY